MLWLFLYQTPRCQGFPSLQAGETLTSLSTSAKKDLTSEMKCGIIDVDLLDGRSTCRHSKSAVPIRPCGTGRCRLQVIPVKHRREASHRKTGHAASVQVCFSPSTCELGHQLLRRVDVSPEVLGQSTRDAAVTHPTIQGSATTAREFGESR